MVQNLGTVVRGGQVVSSTIDTFHWEVLRWAVFSGSVLRFAAMEAPWATFAGLTEMTYPKAGKTNPGFRDEGRDRVPAIVKINKAGKRLACKFNAYGT